MLVITQGGLSTNVVYQFRYRVLNKFGWCIGYSPLLTAITATIPSTVSPPSFSIVNQLNVRIQWTQPYDGGSSITSYSIIFQQKDGSFSQDLTYCDGSQSSVVLKLYCDVPFKEFIDPPFSLQFKDLIVVQIKASNVIGSSNFSDPNIVGINIKTIPVTPTTPPSIVSSNEQSISLTMTQLAGDQTGGSSILYYELDWDSGSGGQIWTPYSVMPEQVGQASISTTINGLTSGVVYSFIYRAQNVFGWSGFSQQVSVKTETIP